MLQAIRDKVTGWIAYSIILLISIPFALWGVNSYLGGGEALPAATVNGEAVSSRDLDIAYADYRRRLAQALGGTIPAALGDESTLKGQVLTQLIEDFALRQYADKHRYRTSDSELNELIRSTTVFQSNGQFDPETYSAQLESRGYSVAGYEEDLRITQAMGQLQSAINATAFQLPDQQEQFVSLSNQTRKIRVLTRPAANEGSPVSEAEIEEYYRANSSRYMTQEQVKVDFLQVSLDWAKSRVDVSEEQLRERYEQSIESYTSAESRTASHILLTLDEGVSGEESEQVREQLSGIRARIENGEDFATLAREYSQDPVSAAEDGNLGEIEKGMMVQAFETVLFGMQDGEISEPVKTSFGWHLIKLEQTSGGEVRSFDEVRVEIEDEIRTELAENRIYEITDNLANLVYEQPDSLLPAAEQSGLELKTSEWFNRYSGVGIGFEADVRKAAFSDEILKQGVNSEAIELSDNRIVYIRLNQRQPAMQRPFDEVKDSIASTLKQQKAREENELAGTQALDALNNGKNLDDIAVEWGIDIIDSGFVARDETEVSRDVVGVVFKMEKPADGALYEGLAHSNGGYSLIELSAVAAADSEVESEGVDALKAASAQADYQAVLNTIVSTAEVVRTPLSELQ